MRVTDEASRAYAIEYFAIYAVGLVFQYVYNAVAGHAARRGRLAGRACTS